MVPCGSLKVAALARQDLAPINDQAFGFANFLWRSLSGLTEDPVNSARFRP